MNKPKKPSPDFPLFPHANGQWAKKIKGKLYYFGKWEDADSALNLYLDQKDYLLAGRVPPRQEGMTVRELMDRFVQHKEAQLKTGELSERTWKDYFKNSKLICGFAGDLLVGAMTPEDFEKLKVKLAEGVGTTTLKNRVRMGRVAFNYYKELTREEVHWGKSFRGPSQREQRKARVEAGSKLLDREIVLRALDEAKNVQLKAMILLGINFGMGNKECAELEWGHINLETGWYDHVRHKTYIRRRAKLWPETVKLLKQVKAKGKHDRLVFITKYGNPWLSTSIGSEAIKLGFSFYNLRHTFRTVADATLETMAVRLAMGHASAAGDMDAVYVADVADERLELVAKYVHGWLFKST